MRSLKFFREISAEVSVQIKPIMQFYAEKCLNVALFSSILRNLIYRLNLETSCFYFYSTSRGAVAGPSGEGQGGHSEPAAKERRRC